MASKALLVMGLLLAPSLAICSEVAARDVSEKSTDVANEKEQDAANVEDAKYDSGGYYPPCPGNFPPICGYYPPRGGYGCSYGWCRDQCCSYAGEAEELEAQAQTHN